jgi:thioredoxin reductase
MIKGAKSIEALSSADTFVFDKTGTLTSGELEVISVDSYDKNWSEEKLLNLTASTEEHYFHPVAEAVVKAAKERGFVHMHHEEVQFIVAHGVKTEIKGKNVVIGSRHFLEDDEKIDFSSYKKEIENSLKKSDTLLYVGYDGKLLGTIGLSDELRENTKESIKRLKSLGVKNIVIAGGGDSALDWSIFLSNVAKSVTLIHRRNEFRGALDSVEKVQELKNAGKINLITPAEVIGLKGDGHIEAITVDKEGEVYDLATDYFIPLFGLTPKLGDIANWGLEIEKNAIVVNNALDYQTNIEGVYAIGDVNTYPGKLKLILCGFHEATLMCQSVYNRMNPGRKYVLKYTTVSGVDGFDGTRKEAEKAVVKKID